MFNIALEAIDREFKTVVKLSQQLDRNADHAGLSWIGDI